MGRNTPRCGSGASRKGTLMVDKTAFHTLSYGLYLITAVDASGKKMGCVANTFQQVAAEPPMASVSLNKENATTQAILETGMFAVSVLGQSATMELIGLFGFKSSRDVDKFSTIEHSLCGDDLPQVLDSCVAKFVVSVRDQVDVGTHVMLIGPVEAADMIGEETPLTYTYYHEVLRGKTPPKAATYTEEETEMNEPVSTSNASEESAPKIGWRCKVCGYIEMVDELPDDFVCPVCGVGKDMFERIEL